MPLDALDIPRLHAAYARGMSPGDVIDAAFARLEALNDPGIFIALAGRARIDAAVAALGPFDPEAKPLWGVPFAVKDNIDVAGLPTTAACPDFAYTPEEDAPAVAALQAAGAIMVGKTNLDQFATGLVGVRTPYPVPRNAVDPALVPGGSSSGSAVAVAAGLVTFALGTDTAGSGRVPAALNNIVGLKPSLGALSTRGVVPACRTLDCVSIFALTVDDAWRAFDQAAGFDAGDPFSRPIPVGGYGARPPHLRVGVPDAATREFFGDTAAARAFETALADLATLGAEIVEIDFTPFFEVARLLYEGAWVAERYAAIAPFLDARPDAVHPVTRQIIAGATRLSAADAFRGLYRLRELTRVVEPVIASVDMFCVPTIPTVCTLAEIEAEPIAANSRLGIYTNFVNLLDLCAMAVPTRARPDGRPGSVTFIAPSGRDGLIASVARDIHRRCDVTLGATGAHLSPPDTALVPTETTGVDIAVVGAHLSGLPLNGELLNLGATFVRAVATKPCYRLYELPGGEPRRPGMLRTDDGDGFGIEVEVWRLPAEAFGRFVAAIPPPLGIGTLLLADGTEVKGFLAEASGVATARDISEFGGWRAFVASKRSVA